MFLSSEKSEIIVELWTLTHLFQIIPTFTLFAILSVIAAKTLGRCKRQIKYIPLKIIAALLLALEVIKQICSIGEDGVYDLYSLPFHYCSLFLYLLPLHAFYRGKHSHIIDIAAFGCLATLSFDILLMPSVIYDENDIQNFFNNFLDFHTVIFHNLVILYFMLSVALKLYEFNTKHDIKVIGIFISVYIPIAAVLSYSLKVNFHNLYECSVGFLEDAHVSLVNSLGIFGTLIYVGSVFALTLLFTFASYFVARYVINRINKIGN